MRQLNDQNLVTEVTPSGEPSLTTGIQPGRSRARLRTTAIVVLIVLLALVFGTGLFAGWVFGTRSSGGAQPTSSPVVATPSITASGTTLDVIRETVVE